MSNHGDKTAPVLHELSSKRSRQDDIDKGLWRRGLALPDRKKPAATQKHPEPSSSSLQKSFLPAPPPKTSAWGTSTQPVKSEIAQIPKASADGFASKPKPAPAPKQNAWRPIPKPDPVPIPITISTHDASSAVPRVESQAPLEPMVASRVAAAADTSSRKQVLTKAEPKRPAAPAPKQSAWNVIPKQTASVPPTTMAFPTLEQQDRLADSQSSNNKTDTASGKQKRKKGKGGTLGDVMPKALLKKVKEGGPSLNPKSPTPKKAKPSVADDFPALSATTSSIVWPSAKKTSVVPPVAPLAVAPPAKSSTTDPTKKRKKKTKPTPAAAATTTTSTLSAKQQPVVLDAHRSGMLFNDTTMLTQMGGRQRTCRPRTKKFSSLKKKVLENRLRKYRETREEESSPLSEKVVVIENYVQPDDDLDDPDEYEELAENLRDMATKVGEIVRLLVDANGCTVEFESAKHAQAAVECWNGLLVAGNELRCRSLDLGEAGDPMDDEAWKTWCRAKLRENPQSQSVTSSILLEKVLTEADLEDEDCLEESLVDIRELASKFGTIESLDVENAVNVRIVYTGVGVAIKAADQLSKMVLGGQKLEAKPLVEGESNETKDCTVYLNNILTEEDLEDEDCLEESLDDVKELAGKFGSVESLSVFEENRVQVNYSSAQEAQAAAKGFHGMVIGGQTIEAVLAMENNVDTSKSSAPELPKTLYSGNKIISERFAECKRAPKIANTGNPRAYATCCYPTDQAEAVKELLRTMLAELMRLQKRAAENEKTTAKKSRRRLVMGLREVARGIRSHKVKMVVMANNLDEYGAIDDKLQEILDLSANEGVPVFFDFSKRALGKALGKSIKVAVVGIQNADGANQEFKKLNTLSGTITTK